MSLPPSTTQSAAQGVTRSAKSGNPFASTLRTFKTQSGTTGKLHSLPALAKQFPNINRLPVSMRIVLESVVRNCDGKKVTAEHVAQVANWHPAAHRTDEIPFVVSRVVQIGRAHV